MKIWQITGTGIDFMIQRRAFIQSVAAWFSSLNLFGKSANPVMLVGRAPENPTGWTITWNDLNSDKSLGYWLALPQSADRHTAFRVLVSRIETTISPTLEMIEAAKQVRYGRVIEMIQESRNGQAIVGGPRLAMPMVDDNGERIRIKPEGYVETVGI